MSSKDFERLPVLKRTKHSGTVYPTQVQIAPIIVQLITFIHGHFDLDFLFIKKMLKTC